MASAINNLDPAAGNDEKPKSKIETAATPKVPDANNAASMKLTSADWLVSLSKLANKTLTPKNIEDKEEERLKHADEAVIFLAESPMTPEKKLALEHLDFLQELFTTIRQFPIELRSDYPLKGRVYPSWNNKGVIEQPVYKTLISEKVDWFLDRRDAVAAAITVEGPTDLLSTIVGGDLAAELKRLGLDAIPKTDEELLELHRKFIALLRDRDLTDLAEVHIDQILQKDFEPYILMMREKTKSASYASEEWESAKDEADSDVLDHIAEWRKQGMTSEQIENTRVTLVNAYYSCNLRHSVAKKYKDELEDSLDGEKKYMFAAYNELLNTDNSYKPWNYSDRRKSQLKEIICRNAPFVALGVGAGLIVRKIVISAAERFFLGSGVKAIAKASASGVGRFVGTSSLFVVDQGVGSAVYRGLSDQWYTGPKDFIKDLLVGLMARGVLHGGEMVTKVALRAVKPSLKFLGNVSSEAKIIADKINDILPQIADPELRDLLSGLLIKKQVVAAATVLYSMLRHGYLKTLSVVNQSYIKGQIADFVADTADSLRIDNQLGQGTRQAM